MEKIFELATLYDFYGPLLNAHQRDIVESYVIDNLSLSEIAQEKNTSRQAVHDLMKRAQKLLTEYEAKLSLVEKFNTVKKEVTKAHVLADSITDPASQEVADEIIQVLDGILDEL